MGYMHCAAPNVTCFFNFCILIILKHDIWQITAELKSKYLIDILDSYDFQIGL